MNDNVCYTEFLSKLDYQSLIRLRDSFEIDDINIIKMIDQEIEVRLLEQKTKKDGE